MVTISREDRLYLQVAHLRVQLRKAIAERDALQTQVELQDIATQFQANLEAIAAKYGVQNMDINLDTGECTPPPEVEEARQEAQRAQDERAGT